MREYLKRLRDEHHLTQLQIANTVGMTQQYLQLIEAGKRQQDMPYSMMERFSRVFNVPVQEIIDAEVAYAASRRASAS